MKIGFIGLGRMGRGACENMKWLYIIELNPKLII